MFNPTQILIEAFCGELKKGYEENYGKYKHSYCEIIGWAGRMCGNIIGNSNALYHNLEHTIIVTLVGQEILKGKHIKEGGVTPEVWLNTIISLMCHDIGMVKGILSLDDPDHNIVGTGVGEETVKLKRGATDASLAKYHVDRGKKFIDERFSKHTIIDAKQIKRNIELTRFPIPDDDRNKGFSYPQLVRSADLVGQLGDARYIEKTAALYYEFEEIGSNKKLKYSTPADLVDQYPKFFWSCVYEFIKPALSYLKLTPRGKNYINGLYANVFSVENKRVLPMSIQVLPVDEKNDKKKKQPEPPDEKEKEEPSSSEEPLKPKKVDSPTQKYSRPKTKSSNTKGFTNSVSSNNFDELIKKQKRRKIHTSQSGSHEFVKRGKTIFRKKPTRGKIGSSNELRGISIQYKGK